LAAAIICQDQLDRSTLAGADHGTEQCALKRESGLIPTHPANIDPVIAFHLRDITDEL